MPSSESTRVPAIGVIGDGAVGRRVRQFLGLPPVEAGASATTEPGGVVVLATPASTQVALARRHLARGASRVVTTTVDPDEVDDLLALGAHLASTAALVVGAACSPGLTTALATVQAARFVTLDEVHVAWCGTGGPACARQHHRALAAAGLDWRDGQWHQRIGGTGRELCWFPDPVGARDCYRAALAEPRLLQLMLPELRRATARVAATRRDRLSAGLPMLRPPHPEGLDGAVRVECRGGGSPGRVASVMGAVGPPAIVAASVAATMATLPDLGEGVVVAGDRSSATAILSEAISRGVRVHRYAGRWEGERGSSIPPA
jgi:hypothetical protein